MRREFQKGDLIVPIGSDCCEEVLGVDKGNYWTTFQLDGKGRLRYRDAKFVEENYVKIGRKKT